MHHVTFRLCMPHANERTEKEFHGESRKFDVSIHSVLPSDSNKAHRRHLMFEEERGGKERKGWKVETIFTVSVGFGYVKRVSHKGNQFILAIGEIIVTFPARGSGCEISFICFIPRMKNDSALSTSYKY